MTKAELQEENSKLRRYKKNAQQAMKRAGEELAAQSDELMSVGIGWAAAAGMGWYMGKSEDADGKWLGIDKEIIVALIGVGVGFYLNMRKEKGSKMAGKMLMAAGGGVGSAYAYGIAHAKAAEKAGKSNVNPDFT